MLGLVGLPMFRKPAATSYRAVGARFDGTNDYLRCGADLTGTADSQKITASVWVRTNIDDATLAVWCGSTTAGGSTNRQLVRTNGSGDELNCYLHNASGSGVVDLRTTGNVFQVSSGWTHWIFSLDLSSTSLRHSYVNDVSNGAWNVYNNDTIDFTLGDFAIGARPQLTQKWNGDIADLIIWQGVYVDLSVTANRRLLRDASGKPVDPAGAIAAWGTPKVRMTNPLSSWHTNAGSGGGFTLNGTLDDGGSPSD